MKKLFSIAITVLLAATVAAQQQPVVQLTITGPVAQQSFTLNFNSPILVVTNSANSWSIAISTNFVPAQAGQAQLANFSPSAASLVNTNSAYVVPQSSTDEGFNGPYSTDFAGQNFSLTNSYGSVTNINGLWCLVAGGTIFYTNAFEQGTYFCSLNDFFHNSTLWSTVTFTPGGTGSDLLFTNAAGKSFSLIVNQDTNGLVFVAH
jgi:hypothetical protein